MHIEIIDAQNAGRNYNYLVGCEKTKQALAIDPIAVEACLKIALKRGWTITHIVNTHEHGDHTAGNAAMKRATGAKLCAHYLAPIPDVDMLLRADHSLQIGQTVKFTVLDTPGHTLSHVCLFGYDGKDIPHLFTGDTLFNAGCGNCYHGGDPEQLYNTFAEQLERLPDETRIYPGHNYIENNLHFAQSLEPDNPHIIALLEKLKTYSGPYITTLREERLINPFLREEFSDIERSLRDQGIFLPLTQVKRKDIFLALRELRNKW
ncbi:MAG TPA: hydroxyacylglutathione hydrolase [Gammaproteobacteria bacterium]|nr:hydroxyacylglutathione hydrolase [Gammaproteobacteria bacterium]